MAVQSKVAVFTGVEPYIDLTWDANYASFVNLAGVNTSDGNIVAYRLTDPADSTMPPPNTGVRVEPTAPFVGTIPVINVEMP